MKKETLIPGTDIGHTGAGHIGTGMTITATVIEGSYRHILMRLEDFNTGNIVGEKDSFKSYSNAGTAGIIDGRRG